MPAGCHVFKQHQIEHQLGAYTDCNHGEGLAVIQPVYYRHILNDTQEKFTRFANVVFGESNAEAGLTALEALSVSADCRPSFHSLKRQYRKQRNF